MTTAAPISRLCTIWESKTCYKNSDGTTACTVQPKSTIPDREVYPLPPLAALKMLPTITSNVRKADVFQLPNGISQAIFNTSSSS